MKITLTARDEVLIAARCLKNYTRYLVIQNYGNIVTMHKQLHESNSKRTKFQRWWRGDATWECVNDHPDELTSFDVPLDQMVTNMHDWGCTLSWFWNDNMVERRAATELQRLSREVRRINDLANKLEGSTKLFRMTLQLNSEESELMVTTLQKCPPQEYIQQ